MEAPLLSNNYLRVYHSSLWEVLPRKVLCIIGLSKFHHGLLVTFVLYPTYGENLDYL